MKRLSRRITCFVSMLLPLPLAVSAVTRYVDPSGGHTGTFESWEDAATNIQAAVAISSGDTTIRVAPGTYTAPGSGTTVVHIVGGQIPADTTFALVADLPPAATPGPVILDGQEVNRGVVALDVSFNVATNDAPEWQHGAGIYYNRGGMLTIESSRLVGNTNYVSGNIYPDGGAVFRDRGGLSVKSSLIAHNRARRGAAFTMHKHGEGYNRQGDLYIQNCTMFNNTTGPLIRFRDIWTSTPSDYHVINTIIFDGSTATEGSPHAGSDIYIGYNRLDSDPTGTTTSAGDWIHGEGNITTDPDLRDLAAGNYRLARTSPCLNAGVNRDWMAGAVDLDGNPRVDGVHRIVDMGAYEFVYYGTTITVR